MYYIFESLKEFCHKFLCFRNLGRCSSWENFSEFSISLLVIVLCKLLCWLFDSSKWYVLMKICISFQFQIFGVLLNKYYEIIPSFSFFFDEEFFLSVALSVLEQVLWTSLTSPGFAFHILNLKARGSTTKLNLNLSMATIVPTEFDMLCNHFHWILNIFFMYLFLSWTIFIW